MAALVKLQAPELDGGVFLPLMQFAAAALNGSSSSSSSSSNSSSSSSSVGDMLTQWMLGRVASRAPSLVMGGLWVLLTIAAFVALLVWTRRRKQQLEHSDSSTQQLEQSDSSSSQQQKSICSSRHLPASLSLVLLVLLVAAVVLLVVYFVSMAEMYSLVSTDPERNSSTTAAGAVQLITHEVSSFIEESLTETNATVLSISYKEFPNLLRLFDELATRLLDLLSVDFKLTPLLKSFDEFIGLVKMLLASMKAIRDSRYFEIPAITAFETQLNGTREDLQEQVQKVCSRAPGNGVSVELCRRTQAALNSLLVGIDHRRIESDSSITVVTLLDTIFKLNITQIEGQVAQAKLLLTSSLDLIRNEVTTLFNSLVDEVSKGFSSGLEGAAELLQSLRTVTEQPDFQQALTAVNTTMIIVTVTLALVFIVMVLLLLAIVGFVCKYLWHSHQLVKLQRRRDDLQMGGDRPPPPENFYDDVRSAATPPLKTLASVVENRDSVDWQRTNKRIQQHRKRRLTTNRLPTRPIIRLSFALALVLSAAFAVGLLLLLAGAELQNGACRYVTEDSGVAQLDRMADSVVRDQALPLLRRLLEQERIPISIPESLAPSGLVRSVLQQCGNSSATVFHIFGLTRVVNVTEVLHSQLVQQELDRAEAMVRQMVGGLNITTLIPKEVDDILATLPEFARIVDSQDYTASIAELRQPLVRVSGSLPALLADLRSIASADPSDSAAVIIGHYADKLQELTTVSSRRVNAGVSRLLANFTLLQANRRVLNMTDRVVADLAALKVRMADNSTLQAAIGLRYQQVQQLYMPEIAVLLEDLLQQVLRSVGHCDRLHSAAVVMQEFCNGGLMELFRFGLFVLLTAMVFHAMMAVLMLKLHVMRHHKTRISCEDRSRPYQTDC